MFACPSRAPAALSSPRTRGPPPQYGVAPRYKFVVTARRGVARQGRMAKASLQSSEENPVSVYDKLKALQITLSQGSSPAGAYVPYVRTGSLVFLSGHIARKDGKPLTGQLGGNLTTEQGQEAARAIAIDLMATLQAAVGDLNKIKRIVKLVVLGNSTPEFTEQHLWG